MILSVSPYSVKVVFTASRSWFGRIIRWATRSHVSHVFLVIPIWDREFAIEASITGVRIVTLERAWHAVESVWCVQHIEDAKLRAALTKITQQLGSPYDWAGTFLLGLLNIIGNWLKLRWQRLCFWRTKALKCSELVAFYFWELGYGTNKHEQVTPKMLREWVEKWPICKRIG